MDEFQHIGKHIVNEDVRDKARGRAVFTGDLKLPKMLHARILRSPFAHARIRAIDKQRAMKVPGVKAILLGKDRPLRFGQSTVKDRPVLAWERVLYWGEPVAVVAAVDEQAACEALERIEVDYEPLPAVFDPLKAMEPDAPLLHPELDTYPRQGVVHPVRGTNICHHAFLRSGDIEKGFKESDRVYENVFRIPAIQHCPLEPHVAVACADGRKVTLWCSTQAPYGFRSEICGTLGWPLSRLRLIAPAVGGGFGGKGSPCIEPIAVLLALETGGMPVRLCLDRDEEFITKVRPALVCSLKTGVKRDGTLVAFEGKFYYDNGAYADQGPTIARNSSYSAMGPYRIPHVTTDVYLIYTNNPVSAAFRGFGIPETAWGCESQLDIIAADLNIDPVTIRMKNALEEGSISPTGEAMRSVGMKGCLHHVRFAMPQENGQSTGVGRGFAAAFKSGPGPSSSSVLLRLNEDGTATLMTSAVDMGQGLKAVLAQIAAEESGLDPESILRFLSGYRRDSLRVVHGRQSSHLQRREQHANGCRRGEKADAGRRVRDVGMWSGRPPHQERKNLGQGGAFAKHQGIGAVGRRRRLQEAGPDPGPWGVFNSGDDQTAGAVNRKIRTAHGILDVRGPGRGDCGV